MRKVAPTSFIALAILSAISCSNGSNNGTQKAPNPAANGDIENACSDAQKIAGQCLFTLDLPHNPELNQCIQEYAKGDERGWHLVSQMVSLTCPAELYNIETLDGIELLTALKLLDISGTSEQPGQLNNTDALATMTTLEQVSLNNQGLQSIPNLGNSSELKSLSLANNAISDAGPLQSFTNLENVNLSGNQIQALGPIPELTGLKGVNIAGNSNFDCDELAEHPELLTTITRPEHCVCILGVSTIGNCSI